MEGYWWGESTGEEKAEKDIGDKALEEEEEYRGGAETEEEEEGDEAT